MPRIFPKKYVNGKSFNFMKIVNQIYLELEKDPNLHINVGDPLHLWKGMRSKYQTNIIKLFSDLEASTDYESAKATLDIGNVLDDHSSIGKMRDSYSIILLSFENVCKLLSAGLFVDSTLFFPFACWIAADYSISIDLQFRLFLL